MEFKPGLALQVAIGFELAHVSATVCVCGRREVCVVRGVLRRPRGMCVSRERCVYCVSRAVLAQEGVYHVCVTEPDYPGRVTA